MSSVFSVQQGVMIMLWVRLLVLWHFWGGEGVAADQHWFAGVPFFVSRTVVCACCVCVIMATLKKS